jgi:hypothetical protein
MPAEDLSCHRWYHRYKVEAVLLGLFAVLAIGGPLCAGYAEFLGGTKNSDGDGFGVFVGVYFLLVLTSLVFIASAIVRFFRSPRTLRHILLQIVFLIAPPAFLVGGFLATPPGASAFLRGFERWVLQEVDTDAIQKWLATEGRDFAGRQYDIRHGFPEELPDFLVRFKPKFISFRNYISEGGPCVEFGWGGGLASWGLIVGLPAMPTPKEGAINLTESETEFRHPVKPGVYVVERG